MCNSEAGVAMLTLREVTFATLERQRLAIPRDLLNMPWHTPRLWVLEPHDNVNRDDT
jgi:hypothetical protein